MYERNTAGQPDQLLPGSTLPVEALAYQQLISGACVSSSSIVSGEKLKTNKQVAQVLLSHATKQRRIGSTYIHIVRWHVLILGMSFEQVAVVHIVRIASTHPALCFKGQARACVNCLIQHHSVTARSIMLDLSDHSDHFPRGSEVIYCLSSRVRYVKCRPNYFDAMALVNYLPLITTH